MPLTMWPPDPHAPLPSRSAMAASCRFVNQAPRGSPVEPEVKQMHTGRLGSSASGGTPSPVERREARTRPGTPEVATTSTGASSGSPSASSSVASTR